MQDTVVALRRDPPDCLADYDRLHLLLLSVYRRDGFEAVVRMCSRAQKEIAQKNRAALDAEGWVV